MNRFYPLRKRWFNRIALIEDGRKITYRELDELVSCTPYLPSVFHAPTTLGTVVRILKHWKTRTSFLPLSPKRPGLPEVQLPKGPFTALETSGTRGMPKIALLPHSSHYYSAKGKHPLIEYRPGDHFSCSLPFNHIAGLMILYRSMLAGGTLVFDPEAPCHHYSFVVFQLREFLAKTHLHSGVRSILLGGSLIPQDLCDAALRLGLPLFITYGMTEAGSQIATSRYTGSLAFDAPLPGREIKIEKEELCLRGKTLFKGYLNNASPFVRGWFLTKDRASFENGRLTILGRSDNLIISGGENIDPKQIRTAALSIPGISEARVTSRPDKRYGHRPLLHVKLTLPLSPLEIRKKLLALLTPYHVPFEEDINCS